MTFDEFAGWLRDEVREERFTLTQAADLLAQRRLFDERRKMIEAEFRQRVAGFVANELSSANTVGGLIDASIERHPGRMLYFEPIGFELFR